MMKLIIKIFFLFLFAKLSFAGSAIVTNKAMWGKIERWYDFCEKEPKTVLQEVNGEMTGLCPWQSPTIQFDSHSYPWGYFLWMAKSYAHKFDGDYIKTYKSVINAYSYLPKKKKKKDLPKEYWDWWLVIGRSCWEIGRYQDALWYYQTVIDNVKTNTETYIITLPKLANTLKQLGHFQEAKKYYSEVFQWSDHQFPFYKYSYRKILFALGESEQGVYSLLESMRQDGVKYLWNDFSMVDSFNYWLYFHNIDVFEWYEILGEQLASEKLEKGKEKLVEYLINTRTLMKKVYPDLLACGDDDFAALKERFKKERTVQKKKLEKRLPKKELKKEYYARKIQEDDSLLLFNEGTNEWIEEIINWVMLTDEKNNGGKVLKTALGSLARFESNQLANTKVDGVSATFFMNSMAGWLLNDWEYADKAKKYLKKAENIVNYQENESRIAEFYRTYGKYCLSKDVGETNRAINYFEIALDYSEKDLPLKVILQTDIVILKSPSDQTVELEKIIETNGNIVPRVAYELLAENYFREGEYSKAFFILCEAIKRTEPPKIISIDKAICALIINKSLFTAAELEKLRNLLRACAMRYPATIDNSSKYGKLFSWSEEPWFEQQIKLADISVTKDFSEENLSYIFKIASNSPSVRSGILSIEAQDFGDETGTNNFDWTNWISALKNTGKRTYIYRGHDSLKIGGKPVLRKELIKVLAKYHNRIGTNFTAKITKEISCQCSNMSSTDKSYVLELSKNIAATNYDNFFPEKR